MKNTSLFRNILMVALCLILTACSTPQRANAPAAPAVEIVIQSTSEPLTSEPSVTPQPTAPEAAAQAPASTVTPEAIAHQFIPRMPVYTNYLPGECNTGFNFQQGTFKVRQPCDVWDTNLLERPVSADLKTFYHYLDILTAQVGSDGDWYYASLNLFGAGKPEDESAFSYFFEIDLDQNGRGDLLVVVDNLDLYVSEWAVTGVRVWRDLNGDVGGPTSVRPDTQTGNGYETLLFDQGQGNDPDLAWVRHDPQAYQRIEFAFKASLLEGKTSFMWWGGAMRGEFSPQVFDLVDNFEKTALFQVDTTCGWIFGQAKGYTFKQCFIAPAATAVERTGSEAPVTAGCVKPPHPNPQDNGWQWNAATCTWELIN